VRKSTEFLLTTPTQPPQIVNEEIGFAQNLYVEGGITVTPDSTVNYIPWSEYVFKNDAKAKVRGYKTVPNLIVKELVHVGSVNGVM